MGGGKLSLLGIYATGGGLPADGVGHAFVTPMSQLGFHGYWGHTGRLTVQGPTDQGIDDPYNIDGGTYDRTNLGRGMATLQARIDGPVANTVTLGAAAGGFLPAEGGLYGIDGLGHLRFSPVDEVALDAMGALTWFGADHHARAESIGMLIAVRLQLEML